jgi:GNAT superfamily N-acetyltransferase
LVHVVDAADRARAELGHARQPVDLGRVAHLVGHQHVLDAAAGEDLGLGHLLAADAAGAAQFHLKLGHVDRLVHLAVHPVAHAVGLGVVAHLLDVALQRVEVEDKAGRLDLASAMPGRAGMS